MLKDNFPVQLNMAEKVKLSYCFNLFLKKGLYPNMGFLTNM